MLSVIVIVTWEVGWFLSKDHVLDQLKLTGKLELLSNV